jgi:hypothetical protein
MAEAISDQSWNFTELDLFDNSDDSHDTDLQTSEAVVRVDSENNMEISEPQIDFIVGPDGLDNINYLYYEIDISNARRNSDTPSIGSTSTAASVKSFISDNDALAMFPIRISATLWKDNPEQDPFNTFSVSEDNLTKIIDYLENVTSKNKNQKGLEVTENMMNAMQEEFRDTVSDKVTFILDTYYSLYMTR